MNKRHPDTQPTKHHPRAPTTDHSANQKNRRANTVRHEPTELSTTVLPEPEPESTEPSEGEPADEEEEDASSDDSGSSSDEDESYSPMGDDRDSETGSDVCPDISDDVNLVLLQPGDDNTFHLITMTMNDGSVRFGEKDGIHTF